jgi:hypothetical protein
VWLRKLQSLAVVYAPEADVEKCIIPPSAIELNHILPTPVLDPSVRKAAQGEAQLLVPIVQDTLFFALRKGRKIGLASNLTAAHIVGLDIPSELITGLEYAMFG